MLKVIYNYAFGTISIMAGLITIVSIEYGWIEKFGLPGIWLAIAITFVAALLFVQNVKLKLDLYKSNYGNAFKFLNVAFNSVHETFRDRKLFQKKPEEINSNDLIEIFRSCKDVCDYLSETFRNIHHKDYAVSIKLLAYKRKDAKKQVSGKMYDKKFLRISTFCRDRVSSQERGSDNNEEHFLMDNTDFKHIFEIKDGHKPLFYSNYLYWDRLFPFTKDYINSNETRYLKREKYYKIKSRLGNFVWPFPYKSTLVVPIDNSKSIPSDLRSLVNNDETEYDFFGFLCIDCPNNFGFDTKYDYYIAKGVADGLYNFIAKMEKKN